MGRHVINLVVWNGKAYLPTLAQLESGIWVHLDPIFSAPINSEALVPLIEKLKAGGHSQLPNMSKVELEKRKYPLLKATGAKSWRELTSSGVSYLVNWTDREVRVDMTYVDKKGRWLNDPKKVRLLALDALLETILATIFEDIRSYPHFSSYVEETAT